VTYNVIIRGVQYLVLTPYFTLCCMLL